jgi:hypothetical protein
MSFDDALDHLDQTTAGHIPKRQSEQVVVKVAQDFEAFYKTRQAQEPEASEDLLVLTTDAKGIVMGPEDLREATRKAAQRVEPTLKTRLSPGKKVTESVWPRWPPSIRWPLTPAVRSRL